MGKTHHYKVTVEWTGNTGTGTSGYRNYERRHEISAGGRKAGGPRSYGPNFSRGCGALESRGIAGGVVIGVPQALVSAFVFGRENCCDVLRGSCRRGDGRDCGRIRAVRASGAASSRDTGAWRRY